MSFDVTIPLSVGNLLKLPISAGETLFVLGANGTGKSNLMHYLYRNQKDDARRISAHRQNWFDSISINLSSEARRNTEANLRHWDRGSQSRWKDAYSGARPDMAIYDLMDAENIRA